MTKKQNQHHIIQKLINNFCSYFVATRTNVNQFHHKISVNIIKTKKDNWAIPMYSKIFKDIYKIKQI